MTRRSKNQKNQSQKPKLLTKDFVELITSAGGAHNGIFQIDSIISKKAERFWLIYISDGFFRIKVSFSGDAGSTIDSKQVVKGSIVQATISTYIDKGVFNAREIIKNWGIAQTVGDPNKWQLKKVNSNSKGGRLIKWVQQDKHLNLDKSSQQKQEKKRKSRTSNKSKKVEKSKSKNKQKFPLKSKNKQKLQDQKQQSVQKIKSKVKSKSKSKSKRQSKKQLKSKQKKEQQKQKQSQQQQQQLSKYTLRSRSRVKSIYTSKKKQQSPEFQKSQSIQIKYSSKKTNKEQQSIFKENLKDVQKQHISQIDYDSLPQFNKKQQIQIPVPSNNSSKKSFKKAQSNKLMTNTSSIKDNSLVVSQSKQQFNKSNIKQQYNFLSNNKSVIQQSQMNKKQVQELDDFLQILQLQKILEHQKVIKGSKFYLQSLSNKKQLNIEQQLIKILQNEFKEPTKSESRTSLQIKQDQQDLEQISKLFFNEITNLQQQKQNDDQLVDELTMLEMLLHQEENKKKIQASKQKLKKSSEKEIKIQTISKQSKTPFGQNKIPELFIQDLHPSMGSNWRIFLKLLLILPPNTNTKSYKYCFIFIDKNGSYIEAQIPSKHPCIPTLQQQSFYQISKAEINNSQAYKLKGISYNISFSTNTTCMQSQSFEVDQQKYFSSAVCTVKQTQLTAKTNDLIVNVIGIVYSIQKAQYIKNGQTKQRRMFSLVDPQTFSEIKVSDFIGDIDIQNQTVVVLFNLKTNLYKGNFQLSVCKNTIVQKNNLPDNQIVYNLQALCNEQVFMRFVAKNNFDIISFQALQNMEIQVQNGQIPPSELKGSLYGKIQSYQRYRLYYLSCPVCKKKLVERCQVFSCVKCKQVKKPSARYFITADFYTNHGKIHVMFDQKISIKILNIKAEDLYQLFLKKELDKVNEYQQNMQNLIGKQILAEIMCSKVDQNNKVSYSLKYLQIVQPQKVNIKLLDQITNYMKYL